MNSIQRRKQQHIALAQDNKAQSYYDVFSKYLLPYKALPEINLKDVTTSCTLIDKKLSQPLIIASMTGGTTHAETLNKNLAIAAEEMHVALGVGSQRVALEIDDARKSFEIVRTYAKSTVIFANMAAVQLNYGYSIDHYRKVVDMVHADALYLHINPLQEAIQPEGDTHFSGLIEKIASLITHSEVPVFVKEVGHGLDKQTCQSLIDAGVAGIDISGVGGTSWAWIEAQRKENIYYAQWFKEFGLPTELALEDLREIKGETKIVVSGGIRSPIQGLKGHLLGADYYSAAFPFLLPSLQSPQEIIEVLDTWQKGLQIGLFCMGVKSWDEARALTLLQKISPESQYKGII